MNRIFVAAGLSMSLTTPAFAYLGPGMGAGTLAVVSGVLLSLGMLVLAIVYYPLKRMFKRLSGRGDAAGTKPDQSHHDVPQ